MTLGYSRHYPHPDSYYYTRKSYTPWWKSMGYLSEPDMTFEQACIQRKALEQAVIATGLRGQALMDLACSHPDPALRRLYRRYRAIAERKGYIPIE